MTEIVVCHKDRWVNKIKLANKKLTLSNYLYKFTAEKYPKENFSFGVYNVIEGIEEV